MPSNTAIHESQHAVMALWHGAAVTAVSIYPHARTIVDFPPVAGGSRALRTALAIALCTDAPSWADVASVQAYTDCHQREHGAASVQRQERLVQAQTSLLLADPHVAKAITALAETLDRRYSLRGDQAAALVQPHLDAYRHKKQAQVRERTLASLAAGLPMLRAQATQPSASAGGLWAVDPQWFGRMQALVDQGTPQVQAQAATGKPASRQRQDSVAIIPISGVMTKGDSVYSALRLGTNTVRTRIAIAEAALDERVGSILVLVDSGGGETAGVHELASDIATVASVKPTEVFLDGLGASAAVWATAGATRITASPTALVGSIGTVAMLHDESERFHRLGVKTLVVSSGPLKGAGAPGTVIADQVVAEVQSLVDGTNAFFQDAVRTGRKLSPAQLAAVSTGGMWLAAEAKRLRLIDEVGTLEQTLRRLRG